MKKCLTILLLTIYLLGTTGVVLSKHFCGTRVAHISLFGKTKSCACGKVKMPKSCCKDTSVKLSTDDNQRITNFDFTLGNEFGLIAILPLSYSAKFVASYSGEQEETQFYVCKNGPPKTPIYIFTHTLLI